MIHRLVAAAALAATTTAQIPALLPYSRQLDLMVVDTSFDGVFRLSDQNQDGDYNDAGEISVFYSDVGTIVLTNPTSIVCATNGVVYVADSTIDIVLGLRDQNGDGDANDAGEYWVAFTSVTNLSGIIMASAQGLTVDAQGRLWVASTNSGSPAVGRDAILLLDDLNGDGDFDDLNEAAEYCTIPTGTGALGNSIPTKVVVGFDGNVYYSEVGSTGLTTKGVWRMVDGNFDGDCNDAGELSLFWDPPFTASPFYWSLATDPAGFFYTTDHSANESVWRGRDANADDVIDPTEEVLFYQTTGSTWWDVVLRDDGVVLLCDAESPDRLTALRDLNGDGDALDSGEAVQAYDSTVASQAISIRGAAFQRAPFAFSTGIAPGGLATLAVAATKPGDLVIVALAASLLPSPVPVLPWGRLEIDPATAIVVGFGVAGPSPSYSYGQPFQVPANPILSGLTFGLQALCGDSFRLFFSNGAQLTIL